MSRSRKKTPIIKQKNCMYYKTLSNRLIRKTDLASGGMFRKVVNPWSICDWAYFPTDKEDIKRAYRK
jgi:hypothetical protein